MVKKLTLMNVIGFSASCHLLMNMDSGKRKQCHYIMDIVVGYPVKTKICLSSCYSIAIITKLSMYSN